MVRVCKGKGKDIEKTCPMHGEKETALAFKAWPVSFKTSDLPRWKPKMVIDRRTLERCKGDD